MFDFKKRSVIILYSIAAGLLLVILQILRYKTMISELPLELAGGVIALVFLAFGLWIGFNHRHHKQEVIGANEVSLGLTRRELDVLRLMCEGMSNQQIADTLYVSLNTIKTHISNIFSKLNVDRRGQAIIKAAELGFFK